VTRFPGHREFAFVSFTCLALGGASVSASQSRSTLAPRETQSTVSRGAAYDKLVEGGTVAEDVWNLLLPPLKGPAPDATAIVTKIVRMGSSVVDPVVGILTGELAEPDVEYVVHPIAIEQRLDMLGACLLRLPRAEVLRALTHRATPSSTVDMRLLVMRWLSLMGRADALQEALTVAASLDAIQYQRAFVQSPIEQALLSFLAEDPVHVRAVGATLDKGPIALAPILARVVATSRVPAAASILLRNMGRAPELDLEIVRGLGSVGAFGEGALDAAGLDRVRAELESENGELQRAAVTTLARLGDADSARSFLSLLSHRDPLTVVAARRGLETLSGTRNGFDVVAWTAWLDGEDEWFTAHLGPLVETVSGTDAAAVAPALDEILRHPLHRHAVAAALRPQLTSEQSARRELFARLFGTLGSTRAVPWLVASLEDEDTAVRDAARASLVQLTGLDLPVDSGKWKALVSS